MYGNWILRAVDRRRCSGVVDDEWEGVGERDFLCIQQPRLLRDDEPQPPGRQPQTWLPFGVPELTWSSCVNGKGFVVVEEKRREVVDS